MFRALLLLLAAALALPACTRRETAVDRGNRSQILHLGNAAEPSDLDPQTNLGVPEGKILYALFEGLTSYDPVTLEPRPAGALRWETSPDGITWRFHLRPGAKWSNGDPITAEDWAWSFRRLLTPSVAAQFAHNAYPIAGAEEYHLGRSKDIHSVGVRAVDAMTLEFTLRAPTSYWASALCGFNLLPVHRRTLEKFGGDTKPNTPWTRPENMVCNGPFRLREWRVNDVVVVEPNPHYWDAARVRLKEIRFYPVDNEDTEERMFRAGQLHATFNVPLSKLDKYRAEDPGLLRLTPYLGTYYFMFNARRAPFDNPLVRRALALALDRKSIVENVARGGQSPAFGFTPPGVGGYEPGEGLRYDPEEARRLLAEAGFPGGKGAPPIELLFNTSEQHRPICEAAQAMWKRELGLDVRLNNQEWKVYLNSMKQGDFMVTRAGWIAFLPDPHEFAQTFKTDSGNNYGRWTDPEYDRLLQQSEGTADNAARFALLREADAIFARSVPVCPVMFYTRTLLTRPSVKGWPGNPLDFRPYKEMWLEEAANPSQATAKR